LINALGDTEFFLPRFRHAFFIDRKRHQCRAIFFRHGTDLA